MYKKHSLLSVAALIMLSSVLLFVRGRVNSQALESDSTVVNRAPSGIFFNYQGQLLDSSDQPIDATLPITFRLYKTLTGGTNCWSEAHSGGNAVVVADGVFSVTLGKLTAINDSCVTDDIYLELVVNGETLSPREQLSAFANTIPDQVTTRGAMFTSGNLVVDGTNLMLNEVGNNNVALRQDGGRQLHLLPWGGTDRRWDQVCIGCATGANLRVNGTTTTGNVHGNGASNHAQIHMPSGANEGNMYLNWSSGRDLVYGGGAAEIKFVVAQSGNGYFSGDLSVHNLTVRGQCTTAQQSSTDQEVADASCGQVSAGSIKTGAVIEANLQSNEEKRNNGNDQFELGDLLCWGDSELELCADARTSLVQAVADATGNPIVLGAEPVKVIGQVAKGQYLVASGVAGYAMAVDDPTFGIVIAQALEDFDGERGIILAMIRKM